MIFNFMVALMAINIGETMGMDLLVGLINCLYPYIGLFYLLEPQLININSKIKTIIWTPKPELEISTWKRIGE